MARAEIDPSRPWRLSHILEGHLSDVKAVFTLAIDENIELIHSASRDETARSWYRNVEIDPTTFQRGATYQGRHYQNAVVHVGKSVTKPSGTTVLGGLDSRILVYETKAAYSEKPQSTTQQILHDHYDNVCHLSVCDGKADNTRRLLISSSWDCTSRVWKLDESNQEWQLLHLLRGHEKAVWAAVVVDAIEGSEKYLTASADLFIRLFKGEQMIKIYAGHTDVVRAIAILPFISSTSLKDSEMKSDEELFVTASNDGSIRVWSLDDKRCPPGQPTNGGDALKILKAEDSNDLLYDVKYAGTLCNSHDRVVFSCGEDRVLRGWNIDEGTVIASIPQPVTSVWSIAIMPCSGDIVTANSDGKVRIFTQRSKSERNSIDEAAVNEVSDEELHGHEELCKDIAASKAKSAETDEESPQGNAIEGQAYDIVVGIDVSDDSDPLPFSINRGDDIRLAAQRFIQNHSLPTSYEDRIVDFVQQVMSQ